MKSAIRLSGLSAGCSLLFLLFFASSCTNVYFENPVPQNAKALNTFPADWAGVYAEEPSPGEEGSIYVNCFRLERLSGTQLLVSGEIRIARKDLPGLKADLEAQKKSGKLISYLLTERFLIATAPVKDENRPGVSAEQQITVLYREGDWYILERTPEPLMLFDLESARMTKLEQHEPFETGAALFPHADSLSSEQTQLVARQKNGGFYLNALKNDSNLWELYYLTQPAAGRLLIKTSELKDEKAFEQRLDFYNGITPFAKLEGGKDYKIAPTDQALEQLLKEEDFLKTLYLKKISDN